MVITALKDIPALRSEFYYIGAPYSSYTPGVTEARMVEYGKVDAELSALGLLTFSPLDKHYKLNLTKTKLPGTYDYWKRYCKVMMNLASGLIIITLDGWKEGPGVQDEIKMALARGMCVYYVEPLP